MPRVARRIGKRSASVAKPQESPEPLTTAVLRHVIAAIPGEAVEGYIEQAWHPNARSPQRRVHQGKKP